MLPFAP